MERVRLLDRTGAVLRTRHHKTLWPFYQAFQSPAGKKHPSEMDPKRSTVRRLFRCRRVTDKKLRQPPAHRKLFGSGVLRSCPSQAFRPISVAARFWREGRAGLNNKLDGDIVNLATVAEFGSREETEQAIRVLKRAGIPWAVQESSSSFELRVAEQYLNDARQYLLIAEERPSAPTETTAARACLECGSFETRKVPAYALLVWLVCVGGTIVLFAFHQIAAAFPTFIFGSLVALWVSRLAGKWRCLNCGWVFTP